MGTPSEMELNATPPKGHECPLCFSNDQKQKWVAIHPKAKTEAAKHYYHKNCLHKWFFKNGVPKDLITGEKTAFELKKWINTTCPSCRQEVNVAQMITLKDKAITWIRFIIWEKMPGFILFIAGLGIIFISLKGKAYFPSYDKNMLQLTNAGLVLGSGMTIYGLSQIFNVNFIKKTGQTIMLMGSIWSIYVLANEIFLI